MKDEKLYDILIIGAGPGGIYAAYEALTRDPSVRIAVLEQGDPLEKRRCPIVAGKTKKCIRCHTCSIMSGFGGAGAFSDGKYNITTAFGGVLADYLGQEETLSLINYVDTINLSFLKDMAPVLFAPRSQRIAKKCLQNNLHLLDAKVRHLGTDNNYILLERIYEATREKVDYFFETRVEEIYPEKDAGFTVETEKQEAFRAKNVIVSVGRSGSKWVEAFCRRHVIPVKSNRVDIGVRIELPAAIWAELTDELYEGKIVYRSKTYEDNVRTFCMNPYGSVVAENTNGIITVNGHSYEDPARQTDNTNFALLVEKNFTEPFNNSNEYGEGIARTSNMLGGGVLVQRFGDLIRGRRTNLSRLEKCTTRPTLAATPGDLSLVMPKRILDDIVEMIYALDKVAPGTANDDTLLYGVEVKFYNTKVELDHNFEAGIPGLYFIGDCSGVTHSLSQAAANGVYIARRLTPQE
ncbi:MAG: FAD-dependent oxidoreductase [Lachnospiraceae bacterium]|nr:FAD-dependent oxidoreductase [Lachnospiraceae bacterium]